VLSRAGAGDSQPLADPAVVERLWQGFADLDPLETHAVDIQAEDPAEATDLLEWRLGDG
jgi:hypothetical protein